MQKQQSSVKTKRRNRGMIYASRIYSTTSFSNSSFHDANDVLDAKSYGDVRGSRSSQSNPIVDIDSWTFPRLHVPIALDLYENAQNSETAPRTGFSPRKWNTFFPDDNVEILLKSIIFYSRLLIVISAYECKFRIFIIIASNEMRMKIYIACAYEKIRNFP